MPKPSSKGRRYSPRRRTSKSRPFSSTTFVNVPQDLSRYVRGLYGRVARQLVVDPSYVGRVARGECGSKLVEDALRSELNKIRDRATKRHGLRVV